MSSDIKSLNSFVWSIAETLRGDFKQSEYGKVILPFVVLRRLDCILEASKPAVLDMASSLPEDMDDEARDTLLAGVVGQNMRLYNLSRFTFGSLKGQDPKETLKDVAELLEQHHADHRLSRVPQGKFALTEGYEKGFLKYLPQARVMLRLYRIWLAHQALDGSGRVSQTAAEFIAWARTRDNLIKSKGYKYERPLIPFAIGQFVDDLAAGDKSNSDNRRAFMRYLQKARSLASNAASGSFPGKW